MKEIHIYILIAVVVVAAIIVISILDKRKARNNPKIKIKDCLYLIGFILIATVAIIAVTDNDLKKQPFEIVKGRFKSDKSLFEKTDKLVNSLYTTYNSYGVLGGSDFEETTSDGYYRIMPIGRLINVKIQQAADSKEYEKLEKKLKKYYKNSSRVRDVYICQGGTIMIDCRN